MHTNEKWHDHNQYKKNQGPVHNKKNCLCLKDGIFEWGEELMINQSITLRADTAYADSIGNEQ